MHTQNTMPQDFQDYIYYLQSEERSPGTIANNLRYLRAFAAWLDGEPVDKVSVSRWKDHLLERGYLPATINGMLASLHGYFRYREWDHCRVRYLRVQRKLFRDDNRALSHWEYQKLLRVRVARGASPSSLRPSAPQASASASFPPSPPNPSRAAAPISISKERSAPSSSRPSSAKNSPTTPD